MANVYVARLGNRDFLAIEWEGRFSSNINEGAMIPLDDITRIDVDNESVTIIADDEDYTYWWDTAQAIVEFFRSNRSEMVGR